MEKIDTTWLINSLFRLADREMERGGDDEFSYLHVEKILHTLAVLGLLHTERLSETIPEPKY